MHVTFECCCIITAFDHSVASMYISMHLSWLHCDAFLDTNAFGFILLHCEAYAFSTMCIPMPFPLHVTQGPSCTAISLHLTACGTHLHAFVCIRVHFYTERSHMQMNANRMHDSPPAGGAPHQSSMIFFFIIAMYWGVARYTNSCTTQHNQAICGQSSAVSQTRPCACLLPPCRSIPSQRD